MPRKPLIRVKDLPYHVTARCNNRDPFQGSLDEIWDICCAEISEITERYQCKIHAFVLMPNHFHLLITVPEADLGIVMQIFVQSLTRKINSLRARSGRVFGGKYHWSLIDNEAYFDCALKYVYRNPVKAQLQERVEEYKFSSLNSVLENKFLRFSVEPPIGHLQNIPAGNAVEFLNWLNRAFPNEEEAGIQKALRKRIFVPPKVGVMNRPQSFEQFS